MSSSTTRRLGLLGTALAAGACALSFSGSADGITRDEVMIEARTQAYHPWTCTSANQTASCASSYSSHLWPGDYMGVAYDWGGYKGVFEFDQDIAAGEGAGSYNNYTSWPDSIGCTTGVDCSGYVSRCWDLGYQENTTGLMSSSISSSISNPQTNAVAGDAFDQAGYHVVLLSHRLAGGEPVIYEATPPFTVWSEVVSWSYLNQYSAIRYNGITGSDAGNPEGTPTNPIVGPTLPGALYTDTRNTAQSVSKALDGCGASPGTPEEGAEYVYEVTITQPGTLRATVSGDQPGPTPPKVDVDVHLYESLNTDDCVARDNTELFHAVDCGTYYVVVDTYGTGSGDPGQYTLELELQNPSGTCGSGPPTFDHEGGYGAPCQCVHEAGYLPWCYYCQWTVVDECLETNTTDHTGFCATQCDSTSDCPAMTNSTEAPVCCETPSAPGARYCLPASMCTPGTGGWGAGGNGTGATGTGGWGTGATGTGAGTAAGLPGGDDDDDSDEEGGCAIVNPGSNGSGLALASLLLIAPLALRRRRSRAHRAA